MNPFSLPAICLLVAGFLEIAWVLRIILAVGGWRPWVLLVTALALVAGLGLRVVALRTIPVRTAYAVWTGIGACGTALVGMLRLGEPRDPARIARIVTILTGVVGLSALAGSGA